MANDNLTQEALNLGGKISPFSGQMTFKKVTDEATGEYSIVSFNWNNPGDIKAIVDMAKKWGLVGFTDVVNLKIAQTDPPIGLGDNLPPKCLYHGDEMKRSKKPGVWFCPKKLLDGNFCNYVVKPEDRRLPQEPQGKEPHF